jgi:hypothetical protein
LEADGGVPFQARQRRILESILPGRAWGLGLIFSENQDVLTIALLLQNTVPAPNELVILKIR